jgi:outer membrane protein TolC
MHQTVFAAPCAARGQNVSILKGFPGWLPCAIICLCGVLRAFAQNNQQAEEIFVTGDQLVQIALTNNLDIRISKLQPQVDQFTLNGLYGAYQPNLTMNASRYYARQPGGFFTEAGLDIPVPATTTRIDNYAPGLSGALPSGLTYSLSGPLSIQNVSGNPKEYEAQPGITLDQPLLKNMWVNNNGYQITVAKNTLRSDQWSFSLQVMTTVFNVKTAYFKLIYARENVKVQQEAVALKDETVKEDKAKVQLGAMRELDERQAESEAASARSDEQTAQIALAQQENVVKALLAQHLGDLNKFTIVPTETLVAVPEHPTQQECWRVGVEERPEMIQAKLKIEKQHVTIKYDFNQLFPEVDLQGSYGRSATDPTFDTALGAIKTANSPNYSYGIVLTIPLGNSGARGTYHADRAALQSLLLQAKKQEWTIVTAIDNDIKSIEADLLKVDFTRQARIYAEEALKAGQEELRAGKRINFEVLQFQDNLTAARLAEISALSDYNTALEQLALDEGTTLIRNHIDLRFR